MKFSKLIVIGIIVAVVGVTAYALANGTLITKEESHEAEVVEAGLGDQGSPAAEAGQADTQAGSSGMATGLGRSQGSDQGETRGNGGLSELSVDTEHLKTLQGKVVSTNLSSSNYFAFESGGKTYDVNVGARWYWEYKGIKLEPGDAVKVAGFEVAGRQNPTLAAGTITNEKTGKTIKVREQDGSPVWRDQSEGECKDDGIGGFGEQ